MFMHKTRYIRNHVCSFLYLIYSPILPCIKQTSFKGTNVCPNFSTALLETQINAIQSK